MFRILKLVLLATAANCAPATFIPLGSPIPQPYFLIGSQPQPQFQYQPLLKLQQPSVAPATKVESMKNQYVFLYPGAQQFPLLALRQEDNGSIDYWEAVNNWWNDISSGFGQNPSPAEPPAESSPSGMKMMMDKKMDAMPLMPASTMPLTMNKQRFYLINSLPQFYGNFAPLPIPTATATITNPLLAIEPLRARSAVDSIPAENEKVEQIQSPDISELVQQPALVQPIQPLQLRSNIVEPLQHLQINQPQVPVVDNEPVAELAAQEVARFLNEARSQDADPNIANKLNENDANKLRAKEEPLEEETSIAQAKPSAIALSGKGGVSSSSPTATAVVGDGGLALASPSAISLSGDFEEEDKKMNAPL